MSSRRAHLPLVGVIAATLSATVALVACSPGQDSAAGTGGGGPASMMDPGELVYVRSCSRCHAADRSGKTDAPALDSVRISTLGPSRLEMTIRYGKGRMEGFGGLTDQEVADLIAYLSTP
ncbi:MAG: c-type cytochrome [Ilumatobacteraceae bacterium]|jgi:mono/diheme cytochrome c family protein